MRVVGPVDDLNGARGEVRRSSTCEVLVLWWGNGLTRCWCVLCNSPGHELSVLLRKIVSSAASTGEQLATTFDVNELAEQLGVSLQRLGAVFTVLESLRVRVCEVVVVVGVQVWGGYLCFEGGCEK